MGLLRGKETRDRNAVTGETRGVTCQAAAQTIMHSDLDEEHTPAAIRERLAQLPKPSYLRDWVYGGIDGAITTFAIVAGVIGAELSARVILILGLANLLADGFSMAAGNYSATKSEVDDAKRLRAIEQHHIEAVPEGEREEVRQLLPPFKPCGG